MKQTKFNKKSWHYKFYVFVTGNSGDWRLPKNLCPYFWKMVVILCTCWFMIPAFVIQIANKDWNGNETHDDIGEKLLVSLLGWLSGIAFVLPGFGLSPITAPLWVPIVVAILFWLACACIVFIGYNLIQGIRFLNKKFRKTQTRKSISNTTGLLESKIDAWYHNHCPVIEWVDEK